MARNQCDAQVSEPPHYIHSYQCARVGKHERAGRFLCWQHARQYDRAKDPARYAAFWWEWK